MDPEENEGNQQIPFPTVTKGNPERDPNDKANDVSDIGDVGIVTRYPALLGDHDDVVDEINNGH